MDTALITPNKLAQALFRASTPVETKRIEEAAAANRAYAKERGDYERAFEYAMIYIQARRKTTELILPNISPGGNGSNQYQSKGNMDVTLADYGFTKMQWRRRREELEVPEEKLEEYRDACIEHSAIPTATGLLGYIMGGPHVSYNSGENEWYTPPEYIEAARRVMGEIDLDPASSDKANEIVKAKIYFTAKDDGLRYAWDGRVWMNPPYSSELIGQFTGKLTKHYKSGEITEAIVLVNNATETTWFQGMLQQAAAVCFVRQRVKFIDMNGNPSGAPLQGQAILYFGEKPDIFSEQFGGFGIVLWARNAA